eukprot:g2351.t1
MSREESKGSTSSPSRRSSRSSRSSSSSAKAKGRPKIKDLWVKILETQKQARQEEADRQRKLFTETKENVNSEGTQESIAPASSTSLAVPPTCIESTIVFAGPSSSGKSTLVSLFLNPSKDPNPKPTVALEYVFGRRNTKMSKQVVHIWELGGGSRLHQLLSIPINSSTFVRSNLVLVLDCTDPGVAWCKLEEWLNLIRPLERELIASLQSSPLDAARIEFSVKNRKPPKGHPDFDLVRPVKLPLTIILSKYDKLDDVVPAERRIFLQAVRHTAHTYGAHLLTSSKKDKLQVSLLRMLLNFCAFEQPLKKVCHVDMGKQLFIPAGKDSFEAIGIPQGLDAQMFTSLGSENQRAAWTKLLGSIFDLSAMREKESKDEASQNTFLEPVVDAALAQKKEELIRYRREQERKQRLAAADAAAMKKKRKGDGKREESKMRNAEEKSSSRRSAK